MPAIQVLSAAAAALLAASLAPRDADHTLRLLLAMIACTGALALSRWVPLCMQQLRRSRLRRRAGCVPVRAAPGGSLDVLLVRSRKHPAHFIFPAGGVERGEGMADAAARETHEEAGVAGSLGRYLGELVDEKSRTAMFALHVEREDAAFQEVWRERKWYHLGVPGTAAFVQLSSKARAVLSPKQTHQAAFEMLIAHAADIVGEHEKLEQAARSSGGACARKRR
mmetsp:Transcript_53308/g.116250  ORF Transcript_53308/g.116250 Transcript_53308/m.116250 type:complete len:224 (+) Transcript_53308:388-1059(+)